MAIYSYEMSYELGRIPDTSLYSIDFKVAEDYSDEASFKNSNSIIINEGGSVELSADIVPAWRNEYTKDTINLDKKLYPDILHSRVEAISSNPFITNIKRKSENSNVFIIQVPKKYLALVTVTFYSAIFPKLKKTIRILSDVSDPINIDNIDRAPSY